MADADPSAMAQSLRHGTAPGAGLAVAGRFADGKLALGTAAPPGTATAGPGGGAAPAAAQDPLPRRRSLASAAQNLRSRALRSRAPSFPTPLREALCRMWRFDWQRRKRGGDIRGDRCRRNVPAKSSADSPGSPASRKGCAPLAKFAPVLSAALALPSTQRRFLASTTSTSNGERRRMRAFLSPARTTDPPRRRPSPPEPRKSAVQSSLQAPPRRRKPESPPRW